MWSPWCCFLVWIEGRSFCPVGRTVLPWSGHSDIAAPDENQKKLNFRLLQRERGKSFSLGSAIVHHAM